MHNQHSNKTISFLMELIFVLFFFTIASAISVFVIVHAHEQNEHAIALQNALVYGENLIHAQGEENSILKQNHFYLNEDGSPSQDKGYYEVTIKSSDIKGLHNIKESTMEISHNHQKLVMLPFVLKEEVI